MKFITEEQLIVPQLNKVSDARLINTDDAEEIMIDYFDIGTRERVKVPGIVRDNKVWMRLPGGKRYVHLGEIR